MRSRLEARAAAIAKAAAGKRAGQIAARLGALGLAAETRPEAVACRGRGLVRRWLGDSDLRFAARRTA